VNAIFLLDRTSSIQWQKRQIEGRVLHTFFLLKQIYICFPIEKKHIYLLEVSLAQQVSWGQMEFHLTWSDHIIQISNHNPAIVVFMFKQHLPSWERSQPSPPVKGTCESMIFPKVGYVSFLEGKTPTFPSFFGLPTWKQFTIMALRLQHFVKRIVIKQHLVNISPLYVPVELATTCLTHICSPYLYLKLIWSNLYWHVTHFKTYVYTHDILCDVQASKCVQLYHLLFCLQMHLILKHEYASAFPRKHATNTTCMYKNIQTVYWFDHSWHNLSTTSPETIWDLTNQPKKYFHVHLNFPP